jgi:hypothetical protein
MTIFSFHFVLVPFPLFVNVFGGAPCPFIMQRTSLALVRLALPVLFLGLRVSLLLAFATLLSPFPHSYSTSVTDFLFYMRISRNIPCIFLCSLLFPKRSHPDPHEYTNTHTNTHTHSHTKIMTYAQNCSLISHTHTQALSLSLIHTQTQTHTHIHAHKHTHKVHFRMYGKK